MKNKQPTNHISIEDFGDYISGWLGADYSNNGLSYDNMKCALRNALRMLEDYQDGIDHFVERKNQLN